MGSEITNGELAEIVADERWRVDPNRSTAEFRVKHFWGLVTVTGHFDRLDGTLQTRGEPGPQIMLTLESASVTTGNKRRDKHLRSADFFDADKHPSVTFVSTRVGSLAGGKLRIDGELSAAGKTLSVEVDASLSNGDDRLEIDGRTTVDRTLLGMTWSPLGMASSTAELHVAASLVPDLAAA